MRESSTNSVVRLNHIPVAFLYTLRRRSALCSGRSDVQGCCLLMMRWPSLSVLGKMCPSTVNHLSVSVDVQINRLVPVKYLRTCEHVCSSLRRCGREAEAAVCRVAGALSERRGGIQRPPNVLKGSAIVGYIVKSFTDQISSEIRHVRL